MTKPNMSFLPTPVSPTSIENHVLSVIRDYSSQNISSHRSRQFFTRSQPEDTPCRSDMGYTWQDKEHRANRMPLSRLKKKNTHTYRVDAHFGHPILLATCNRNLWDFRTVLIFIGALCRGRKKHWFTTSRSVEITCQESNSCNIIFNVQYELVKESSSNLKI